MTINSKAKGARGERELAKKLRECGFENARRSVQYCGKNGDADIIDALPGVHIECKYCEVTKPYDWLDQAKRDCKDNIPVVMHRKNDHEWIVIQRLEDWIEMYKEGMK